MNEDGIDYYEMPPYVAQLEQACSKIGNSTPVLFVSETLAKGVIVVRNGSFIVKINFLIII